MNTFLYDDSISTSPHATVLDPTAAAYWTERELAKQKAQKLAKKQVKKQQVTKNPKF